MFLLFCQELDTFKNETDLSFLSCLGDFKSYRSYNYRAASLALYQDSRLLDRPEQVATNDGIAWDTSYWFWSANVHDRSGVQNGNFGATISAINGGIECGQWPENPTAARKRIDMYKNVLRAFSIFKTDTYCSNACDCVIPTGSSGGGSSGGSGGGSGSGCSRTYVVQSGDSFWLISTNNGMSIDQLQTLNPSVSNPSSIYPGQVLCIRR
jgi:LysM domain